MKDRQPLKPNRVLVTPENGAAPFYATITRADEPAEEGHRLNKYTLLKDITCGMLGLDPETAVPDDALQMLAALASSGGSGSGDVGELEDLTVKIGTLTNAGAGWNSYKFPEAMEAAPQVVLQPVNFSGWVEIKSVTAEGFLYCLRQPTYTDGSVTTGSYYTASGTSSSSAHTANTLVSAVTLPTAENKTTAEAVEIIWIAIEFNGGDD